VDASAGVSPRVAFLRAVNLGRRTVPMPRLVEVLDGLGFREVWTYVNSGNAVFDATGSRPKLEDAIEAALESTFGFEVTTFVRTPAELTRILAVEPFELADGDTYFITFLKAPASAEAKRSLEGCSNQFDTLVVDGREVYWRMRGRSTETTLKKKDWKVVGELGSTSRNVTMLRKLMAKIDA
jgi:uncharacterized protein (DUF1697 family)